MIHDKLAMRLAQILMRFNDGERFSLEELADEFNVDIRTIQRDLNDRLSFMPIKRENGKYFLEPFALGKLSFKDIQNFALLSGIGELYPKLDSGFIVDLLSEKINSVFMVKNEGFERVDYALFELISVAILRHNVLSFVYKDKDKNREVNPYKLVNNKGIWYVLADEGGKLKHFALGKIKDFQSTKQTFIPQEEILKQIKEDTSVWLNATKEATIKLDKKGKDYFFRKKLFEYCEIVNEDEKYFILNVRFSYDDELLNVVKQWIPYIKIISPLELKEKLHKLLQDYLDKDV